MSNDFNYEHGRTFWLLSSGPHYFVMRRSTAPSLRQGAKVLSGSPGREPDNYHQAQLSSRARCSGKYIFYDQGLSSVILRALWIRE
jgi:hypothetical protein